MSTAPKSNLSAGIGGAVAGALVGASVWAVLVSVTDYKIGYFAVAIGALAGFLAGRLGGSHPALPFAAAAISVVGCLVGDLLIDAHLVVGDFKAENINVSTFKVLKEMAKDPGGFGWQVYKAGFSAMDLLFYALAGVAGFRLATIMGAKAIDNAYNAPRPTPTPTPASNAPSGAPVFPPAEPVVPVTKD